MPPDAVKTTRMTFDDEFNTFSSSADGSMGWMTSFPYGGNAAYTLAGNNEEQFYSNPSVGYDPFSLQNGVLDINAMPGSNQLGLPYNSGLITTYNSFAQTYGYMEVRAKLPAGQGLWPAFWLLPASNVYSSELDVFEVIGSRPNVVNSTVHGVTDGAFFADSQGWVGPDTSADFHTYGVDWAPGTTTFYMDGKELGSTATPQSMNEPMYMLLNLAVGGKWPGSPDGTTQFPATMSIDYVRAYATANTLEVSGPAALSGNSPPPPDAVPPTAAEPSPPVAAPQPGTAPGPTTLGSGPDTIRVSLSADAWEGDAQALITIDDQTIGGTQTVSASHADGETQEFVIAGNWGSGPHSVGIQFINDAHGGMAGADRNLYIDGVSLGGVSASPHTAELHSNGQSTFNVGTASSSPVPASGTGALVLHLSEDAYDGDATFTVAVDGVQQGDVRTATASHTAGATQDFSIGANLSPGQHEVTVSFLNDKWDGSPATDRNLYMDGADYAGRALPGAEIALFGTGAAGFSFMVPA